LGGQYPLDPQPIGPGFAEGVTALVEGTGSPLLAHALIVGLTAGAYAWALLTRSVAPVPSVRVTLALVVFFAAVWVTVFASSFLFESTRHAVFWSAYGLVFFATTALVGRVAGPRWALAALVAGCAFVALKAVVEYGQMRGVDPNWRVFGGWVNPNALAAMLMLGLLIGVGLLASARERVHAVVAGAAVLVIGFALLLTGSRGGMLSAVVGLGVFLVLAWRWAGWRRAAVGLAPIALVALLAVALSARPETPGGSGGTAGLRATSVSATGQQSAEFRTLLWRSAADLARARPYGVGLGAFRFESARPGLVEQTVLAHQTYLQLLAETGLVSLLGLLAVAWFWLSQVLRSHPDLGEERDLTRAGIVAAVVGAGAHNLIDSNLYYFGVGYATFALLALGLQFAVDGSGPEAMPTTVRRLAAFIAAGMAMAALYFAWGERLRGRVVGEAMAGGSALERTLDAALAWAPRDGDTWALAARYDRRLTPAQRIAAFRNAAAYTPSTRNLRALARALAEGGEAAAAEIALRDALDRDPRNMNTLDQLWRLLDEQGRREEATAVARKLVAVEQSPSFRVRALPELVPTQTFVARLRVAEELAGEQSLAMRRAAFEGFARYARVTVPAVMQAERILPGAGFAGESIADAREKLDLARAVGLRLVADYRAVGRDRDASAVEATIAEFPSP
jgi:O-antigen ligase/tetratricopeptide (TPR) repeat protein